MSFSNLNIGTNVENFETSEVFDSYGRVDVVMGEDEEGNVYTISFPDISDEDVPGRILTVDMPMCTDSTLARTAAQRIYNSLTSKNNTAFQYPPMKASGTLADPSIEFGDSVDINGVHSGFYVRATTFGQMMKTDLSAPCDEEIDHEYPYEDAKQRQITRTNKQFRAGLYVNATAIAAEVAARTAEGQEIKATLQIHAREIAAKVEADTSAGRQSFGWKLTATDWSLWSSNKRVLYANNQGLTVEGTITATGGQIGGFSIGGTSLTYNGLEWNSNNKDIGVYIGQNGIQLGKNFRVTNQGAVTASNLTINGGSININGGKFSVDSRGNVEAKSLKLYGELTMYDANGENRQTISADTLAKGASAGYNWQNNAYQGYSSRAEYTLSGAGGGLNYNGATERGTSNFPAWFTCKNLQVNPNGGGNLWIGDSYITAKTVSFKDKDGKSITLVYLGPNSV